MSVNPSNAKTNYNSLLINTVNDTLPSFRNSIHDILSTDENQLLKTCHFLYKSII